MALDISAEMLSRARQIHADGNNVLWVRVNGVDLACLATSSVDFAFSYLVLQHLPNEKLAFVYIEKCYAFSGPEVRFSFNLMAVIDRR